MFDYKSTAAAAAIVASLAFGSAAVARDFPDTMAVPDNPTAAEITDRLEDAGFSSITDAELSGSIYEAKAMWGGEEMHLRLDTESGELLSQADSSAATRSSNIADSNIIDAGPEVSDEEIKDQLTALGYSDLGEVRRSGDVIDVEASKGDEDTNLRIDQETGVVSEQPTLTR